MPPLPQLPQLPPLPPAVRRFLPLALALVMGFIAVSLVQQYLAGERRKLEMERQQLQASYRAPIGIIVAAMDLPPETLIEVGHLAMAQIPEEFVQPYAVQAPDQLVGKVTVAPIAQGEQLLLNKLKRPDEAPLGGAMAEMVPKGRRAVTISMDPLSGVGGWVRPGDQVDVLWTVRLPQIGEQQSQIVTLVLFQGVPVLAIGPHAGQSGQLSPEEQAVMASQPQQVTLALLPQEASILLFAREQGQLQLSLRSGDDKDQRTAVAPTDNNVLLEYVFGRPMQPPPPPPEPATPQQRTIEIYRGLDRSVVSVEIPPSESQE